MSRMTLDADGVEIAMQGTTVQARVVKEDGVDYLRIRSLDGRIVILPDGFVNQISLTVDVPAARADRSKRGR